MKKKGDILHIHLSILVYKNPLFGLNLQKLNLFAPPRISVAIDSNSMNHWGKVDSDNKINVNCFDADDDISPSHSRHSESI